MRPTEGEGAERGERNPGTPTGFEGKIRVSF